MAAIIKIDLEDPRLQREPIKSTDIWDQQTLLVVMHWHPYTESGRSITAAGRGPCG
jgi:hypothetical protein